MSIERQLEREEDTLSDDLEEGRIDQAEYNILMRDLQREVRLTILEEKP